MWQFCLFTDVFFRWAKQLKLLPTDILDLRRKTGLASMMDRSWSDLLALRTPSLLRYVLCRGGGKFYLARLSGPCFAKSLFPNHWIFDKADTWLTQLHLIMGFGQWYTNCPWSNKEAQNPKTDLCTAAQSTTLVDLKWSAPTLMVSGPWRRI